MLNWFAGRGKRDEPRPAGDELRRLEQHIERLERTLQALANETRKQSVVVRQLHIHRPVVENVTFRLDSLDIDELSGSLNLGNNFDVQLDPDALFGRKKESAKRPPGDAGAGPDAASPKKPEKRRDGATPEAAFRRTPSGFSVDTTPYAHADRPAAPNREPPSSRKL
ncbi:hypothetical protein [Paenibacillus flagellatus]|uniref:Spore germination protein GerPC n=1 Tax=Paenibacillus flagellatus TaxID=2211139 RepID=A0A2V5K7P0_9BACL|nr:hypothetical protein [Paenibacillus flagellatus]PYI55451.1 hypothetical protein DLM86_06865 [Paenibacillus flagellatus]